jgi:N-methylhydantoinase A
MSDLPTYFLGVDVGGTFTDVVLGDSSGGLVLTKVTTTPDDPRVGVARGITEVLDSTGVDPARITRLVHGTTLATNVILEQRGAELAFVTTAGFADLLRLGREARQEEDRFDLSFTTPVPPVPRHHIFEVEERVDARGNVVVATDPEQVAAVARQVADAGVDGVAICLLHSYAHPDHEAEVAEACRAALPDSAYVITSAEVLPEMREYRRAMTTVMCAYVGPVMSAYLSGLGTHLAGLGITCPIEIMESSGGVMSASLAARRPITTVESGGAAGVIAAGFVGGLIEAEDVLSFDMGGTTAKAGIVRNGRPEIAHNFHVGGAESNGGVRRGSGFPIAIPVVDLAEVGAGGGSIASVDSGGSLRVGPASSGSVPGPACYGRGGTEPTVTDANLVLGYLRPGALSGGVSLDPELSANAIARAVADPLGLSLLDAARAIHDVANANMAAAIRMVTVQRGIDPRGFTLVGFGGAGPMHAVELAETFGIADVVIPRAAGVASAMGLIASDLVVERSLTRVMATTGSDPAVVDGIFDELERRAVADLPDGAAGRLDVVRAVEVRYRGQAHELGVDAPSGALTSASIEQIEQAFTARYRQDYGIDLALPTELVNFRVRVIRIVDKLAPVPDVRSGTVPTPVPGGSRPVAFAGSDPVPCPVYAWDACPPGTTLRGPAVVEGGDTTVVVLPDRSVTVDRWWNLVIRHERLRT